LVFLAVSGWRAECMFGCVGLRKKEHDNDASARVRDCLAQSETAQTSTMLGADQREFRIGSLPGSAVDSHHHRVVLEHYFELGDCTWWPSRLINRNAVPASKTD